MLTRLLFESLLILGVTWVGVQFVLTAIWSWRRSRPWAKAVWAGFIALPLLLVVSSLVVTDRERIIAKCEALADAVEAGNVATIEHALADGFEVEGLDQSEFIDRLERAMTRYRISDVTLRQFEVRFPGEIEGVAEFHGTARVRSPDMVYEWVASRWRLTFLYRGNTWRLAGIKSVPTPQFDLAELSRWLR